MPKQAASAGDKLLWHSLSTYRTNGVQFSSSIEGVVHVNMSAQAQAYDYYKKASIETVSSEKLLIMLYDGAIRFLGNAQKAIDDKNIEHAHNQIVKTEDIIIELMSTLDMQYEISTSLYSLYEYMYRRLVDANITKDKQLIEEVKSFLSQLRDTWVEAIDIVKGENRGAANETAAGEAGLTPEPAAPVPAPAPAPVKPLTYTAGGGGGLVRPAGGLNVKG